ncbi:LINE-1 retrotransposable element ORF2 protein [Vitis vinifera]|uniref:LINE-1 retrotransposable element ORF2 protein n=1 Tax=Vitis vinifera TaxID=29760 RepID=A0A438F6G8_VITVI|nr:LINE-1 retrotransposable element ORF2 protein [Vitis vinifera]
MTDGVVKSLGVGRFLDWRTLEAAGAAGELWENGAVWVFTGVYGPFTKKDRECLWDELGAVRGLWGDPWCVGGDFNVILAQGERSRQGKVTPAMRRFAQVMDDLELIDLPLQGGSFTWSGGLHNQAWARLDRFLVSPRWLDQFSNGMSVSGRASYKLATKLKGIKQNLKIWNREVFGNLESNKLAALQQVDYWDQVESERRLSEEEFPERKKRKKAMLSGHLGAAIHGRGGPFGPNGLNGDKAPGPDGFTGAFWQFCWEFVKEEVLEMFKEFHEHKTFLKSLNATFLVLIPKKGAEELGDFRPISLLGGLYKLLAKVLANRIKDVIGRVISSD